MAPHDLLCRWCSTFVGKGKYFCSIFCESKYTRSKRRKLAFKRPVHSSGQREDKEYVSPRTNKTVPARKEQFLEDVITAIETDLPSDSKDKRGHLFFTARDYGDEVGYCQFCCRPLYIAGTEFCDRGCKKRKQQLSWKTEQVRAENLRHYAMGVNYLRPSGGQHRKVPWNSNFAEMPRRRNRYIWEATPKNPEDFNNYSNYKPS